MKTPTKEQIKCANCKDKCGCYFDHLREEFFSLSLQRKPTREQIIHIIANMPNWKSIENLFEYAITEWEKIRS